MSKFAIRNLTNRAAHGAASWNPDSGCIPPRTPSNPEEYKTEAEWRILGYSLKPGVRPLWWNGAKYHTSQVFRPLLPVTLPEGEDVYVEDADEADWSAV